MTCKDCEDTGYIIKGSDNSPYPWNPNIPCYCEVGKEEMEKKLNEDADMAAGKCPR